MRIAGQEHPLADVLAREVQEWLRRLQNGGRNAGVAGALEGGDERFGALVARGLRGPCCCTRHATQIVFKPLVAAGFSTRRLRFRCCCGYAVNGSLTMTAV